MGLSDFTSPTRLTFGCLFGLTGPNYYFMRTGILLSGVLSNKWILFSHLSVSIGAETPVLFSEIQT
jgi:hypothetical protein